MTKRLTISRDAFNYYRDSVYLPNNTCKSLQDFINEQRTLIAQTSQDCVPDCAKCRAEVGTFEQFRADFIAKAHVPAEEVPAYADQIAAAYKTAVEGCDALCGDNASDDNVIRTAMLQDLTPPYGQYADTTKTTSEDKYSIFYIDPKNEDRYTPVFQLDDIVYKNASGEPDKVYDLESGLLVDPQTLSKVEFTQNFRSTWAEALLPYHPEYCKLQELESLKASSLWDRKMEAVGNYRDALTGGYLNPTGISDSKYSNILKTITTLTL